VRRRSFLLALLGAPLARAGELAYPAVKPGRRLRFPRDHGAHPEYRTEWWYAAGWLARGAERLGFQVTFFRTRTPWVSRNPSKFAPRQLLLAHAAIADPRHGRLRQDERAAREAFGLAGAATRTTQAWIDGWRFALERGAYHAKIAAREFNLDLVLEASGAPLLQGEAGYSRKGPGPGEASYYYSRPQMAVTGKLDGDAVRGVAWLDHEWSSQYLAPEAAGWDWCGLNLDDGRALMAFRIRDRQGGVYYAPQGVSFTPLRSWRSPRTGVEYPVAMRVSAGGEQYDLTPLMDDQEFDARRSTGTIYWEGAVRALRAGTEVGRGYLELAGYWRPMVF
jgi:predicted secreted hydrolase